MTFKTMHKRTLRASSALTGAALLAAFAPVAAFAQDAEEPVTITTEETEVDTGAIIVTGSRVRRDEFSVAEPITVITADEITQAGFGSTAEALQSGAVTQGAGQINNYFGGYVTDGGTGANTLGLRGLGPARTLILLNGRRLAPGGTRGSVVAADLNVLPSAIIDRIEILKAGASSVYGSDAVAGVVNIITDQQLEGLYLSGQVNVPEVGAGNEYRISGSFGFNTDRLKFIGSMEYYKRTQLSVGDAPWANCPIGGYLAGEGSEFGSDDYIDPNTGEPACWTLDNGGVTINTLGAPARLAIGRTDGLVGAYNRFVPAPGVTDGPFPGYLGVGYYDRDAFDPDMLEEPIITAAEIYTGFMSATYDFDFLGNAQAYAEVLGTRRKSSSPLYRQLSLDYSNGSPLLPEELRDGLFLNPNNVSNGNIIAARAFIGYGLTDAKQSVDYVRIGGGLRGDFFLPDWRYDAYVGKSWNDGRYEIESFLIDRVAASLDVVDNGDGTFSCASAGVNANCVAAPALSADVIGGNLPQEYRDYIVANTIGNTQFRETTYAFNIDGPLFAAPGGDVQLALGAEYRKQEINDQPDANSINGNLLGLTAGTPTVGTDNVKEVFGEVFVPLLADIPGFYRLNVTGSARYTDYASYGSDETWKLSGEWEIIRGFGLRGSYGTSYRAPALAEQFLGATSGFLASSADPCDDIPAADDRSPNQQIIATNCAAIGLPEDFTQTSGVSVFRVGGAEAGLEAETSKNWSVGGVINPPLPASVGSISLSLDYFSIKVENGVQDLAGGTILNRCYSDPNFNPTEGFCRFVTRDQNNALTVVSSFVNLSEDVVKGYEFNGRYRRDLFGGDLRLNANVVKYTEQSSRLFPEEYRTDANGIVTQPDWVGSFDVTYGIGDVTFRYGLDWTDGDNQKTYEYFAYDELTGESDPDLVQAYKDVYSFDVDDYFLHSASVQFNTGKYEFTAGVRNMFDTKPPRITAAGFSVAGNAPLYSGYDYRGRTFFLNATVGF